MRNQTGRSPESNARGNGMVFALFLPIGMVEITAALDSGHGIHGKGSSPPAPAKRCATGASAPQTAPA